MSSQNIHRIGAATSSSSSALLLILLLLVIISNNTDGAPNTTVMSWECGPVTYNEGDPYGHLIYSVLLELKETTPYEPNCYTYVDESDETSTVHGFAECNGGLGPDDCSECLERAIFELGNLCRFAVDATLNLKDCEMAYTSEV